MDGEPAADGRSGVDAATVSAGEVLSPGAGAGALRRIGSISGSRPGPLLLVVAGIHGNEPAGVHAARRVLAALASGGRASRLRGDLVALAGNRSALARGERFIERDLNRGWSESQVTALRARGARVAAGSAAASAVADSGAGRALALGAEDAEQLELLAALEQALGAARGPAHFLDLHTTSAAGVPFVMSIAEGAGRAFARHVPLPAILGLLERVDGVLLRFLAGRGCAAFGIEGGQNDDPRSIDHHAAALWLAIAGAGLLSRADLPEHPAAFELLASARGPLPQAMEVCYRHEIGPDDDFRMEPGYANIQRVARGALLARDRRGEIRAEDDALLMLPLYQARGDDGFFLGKEVLL